MAVEYNLGWLGDFLEDQLNYTKNSIGARERYNSYFYHIELVKSTDIRWPNQLLLTVQKGIRYLSIARINPDLSAYWIYQCRPMQEWPRGICQLPITQQEDEQYELYVYTKYLVERSYSLFI